MLLNRIATMDCDVLIIGAGPTGFMLAIELTRANISCVLIDAKKGVSDIIKATAISSRALEAFDDLDGAKPFVNKANFTHALNIYIEGQPKLHLPWVGIESKYPSFCLLGQNYVEKFQEDLLNSYGNKVHWNTSLIDFQQNDDDITGTLEKNGKKLSFTCRYLIGCDGSNSTVREIARIPLYGKTYPNHYLIADVHISGDFSRKDWYFFLSRQGFCSIGGLPDGRWGVLISLPKGKESETKEMIDLAKVQSLFDKHSSIPGKLSDPRWISHFHTHMKYVKNRQQGRIFLCGDAAHQISPLTSLGMNSGLLDAKNLAWKLALVCQGIAQHKILATYDQEQRQTIKTAQRLSDANERSFAMTGVLSREVRDHFTELFLRLPPVMRMFGGIMSQINIAFKKSALTDEFVGLPLLNFVSSKKHLSSQKNCLNAWMDFSRGPKPGSYSIDIENIYCPKLRHQKWLFDNTLKGKHALLLFMGITIPDEKHWASLKEIADFTNNHYSKWINIYFIIADEQWPEHFNCPYSVFFDKDKEAHQRYGATADCLYLIRPDRFVAYRSLPPRLDMYIKYLTKVFSISSYQENE